MVVSLIIAVVVSLAIFGATVVLVRKKAGGTSSTELSTKIENVQSVIDTTKALLEKGSRLGSKAQLQAIEAKAEEAKTNLIKEKNLLKEIESKLDTVQKQVEEKEAHHQSMKTTKEEDEAKLTEIMAKYESISQESIELEQQLAASMKNLDSIIASIPMNDNQKAILGELSETLTNAGARMRDLLTEYSLSKERLDALTAQHNDLEEEYTRLVEQQLGE